jgi:hypothetical protein
MRSSTSPSALKISTGILRPGGAQRLHQASPSSFGSMRSTMARSTAIEEARCSPSRPFPATSTVWPDLAQRLGQIIARHFVIFNNQDVHGSYLTDVGPVFVGTIDSAFSPGRPPQGMETAAI